MADPDPGIPDTVKIGGGPLIVGQSRPITLTIVNDQELAGIGPGFLLESDLGGFAVFDSAIGINRLADPSVLDVRIVHYSNWDNHTGISPDTLITGCYAMTGNYLPNGNTPILELYFTGLSAGFMTVDSTFFPPAGAFLLTLTNGQSIYPQFATQSIQIIEETQPPVLTIHNGPNQIVAGDNNGFQVEAQSPEGFPVELEILEMVGFDDESQFPTVAPELTGDNPAQFTWSSTSQDIGIWKVTFQACDSTGNCATASTDIQVVGSSGNLITFDIIETTDVCNSSGLVHGDFDDDGFSELFTSGTCAWNWPNSELYDYQNGVLEMAYRHECDGHIRYGPHAGYFNGDGFLDVILMDFIAVSKYVLVLAGNGENSFSIEGVSNDGTYAHNTALGEFTGDNHLDLAATTNDAVHIFAGNSNSGFTLHDYFPIGEPTLSINAADFNSDGHDDLAIGTENGIRIYLADGEGDFSQTHFYSQVYGSLEIEVTNKGSDFNNDNIFDLCISTPSVGEEFSDMVVYQGNGDGSFAQNTIRTVKGQIFGNCIGDFNNDNELDIAYVNGALEYAAILFGDGDGEFTDELRYDIPHHYPQYIDCFDMDLDGDLEIVLVANDAYNNNSIFTLMNQLDPAGFSAASFKITACDNAEIELISSSGKIFNSIKNTMPTGEYHKCNLDYNSLIDDFVSLSMVESGEYLLKAIPKPNLPEAQPFTLEFTIDDELYRLAKDIPMRAGGYRFNLYAGSQSEVTPRPGKLTGSDKPTFQWPGGGNYDFQLAADIDFSNMIINTQVEGNSFTPASSLPATDTTTFYWRVKGVDDPDYECLYVVNISLGVTDAGDDGNTENLPDQFSLANNYPNPFNPNTIIEYTIPRQCHVTVAVFNLLGQKITTLVDETKAAGHHSTSWDGLDQNGQPLASGVYLYRIKAGDYTEAKKMLLQK
jgi:hypothetical protein